MVVVKVRETYDLHTVQNKMTVIGIHTPKPDIIKKNFPGLLMQCKAYRPLKADVVISCASVLPLDPQGVGTAVGDVAPEDVFNPILYKAMSNKGMSQLEARIDFMSHGLESGATVDVRGNSADVEVDTFTNKADEFSVYYGLLSNSHGWKTANPQQGLVMRGLRPLVYEMVYNFGDSVGEGVGYAGQSGTAPKADGSSASMPAWGILGKAKEFPFLNCLSYSTDAQTQGYAQPGFNLNSESIYNCEVDVPYLNVVCGAIIIPPSRRHELFYRMTISWEIEFSAIRPIGEITDWNGLASIGSATHYQNYSYASAKKAITGDEETILEKDACMVASNVDIEKVM